MEEFDGVSTESVEYEPVGVKRLLVGMKDRSELIVDLAYSALLHNSEPLAGEVLDLEAEMDILQLQTRMNMLMAARNTRDAEQLAPVLGMVGAAEKISEAAGDIASVVLGEDDLPLAIRAALPEAVEVLARAELVGESRYAGRTLVDIDLETETGVRVIAVRRDGEWLLDPDRDTRLVAGDTVLLRGPEDTLRAVYETVTEAVYERPAEPETRIADMSRAVDTIVLMKNVSELAVDLAYASVLFDDEELAEEVLDLEVEVDALQSRLEAWTLQAAGEVDDPVALRGFLHLANSAELISDAALEITEGILRDIDTHPVIAESVRESEIAVRRVRVGPRSDLDGATVGVLLAEHSGVSPVAIHRTDDEWVFYPTDDDHLGGGDVVIVRGTWDATERLIADAGAA
jgi:uncharacterized protein with PhoU and TrkA domain